MVEATVPISSGAEDLKGEFLGLIVLQGKGVEPMRSLNLGKVPVVTWGSVTELDTPRWSLGGIWPQ